MVDFYSCVCVLKPTNLYQMPALYETLKYRYKDKWEPALALKVLTVKQSNRKYNRVREILEILQSSVEVLRTDFCGSVRNMWVCHSWHCRNCSLICAPCTPVSPFIPLTLTYLPQEKKRREFGGHTAPIIQTGLTKQCWCTKPALQGANCRNYTMTHSRDTLSDRLLFLSTLGCQGQTCSPVRLRMNKELSSKAI